MPGSAHGNAVINVSPLLESGWADPWFCIRGIPSIHSNAVINVSPLLEPGWADPRFCIRGTLYSFPIAATVSPCSSSPASVGSLTAPLAARCKGRHKTDKVAKIRNVGTVFQRTEKETKKEKSLSEKRVFTASNKDAESVALCLCTAPALIAGKELFIAIRYQVTYPREKLGKHQHL